jgi:hypothetical protein
LTGEEEERREEEDEAGDAGAGHMPLTGWPAGDRSASAWPTAAVDRSGDPCHLLSYSSWPIGPPSPDRCTAAPSSHISANDSKRVTFPEINK